MKRLAVLSLDNVGTAKEIRRGEFQIDADKVMRGVRLKVAGTITKSDAGTTTLSLADKLALLAHILVQFEHGPDGAKRVPFQDVGLDRMRMLERECYQAECALFTDTSTGLGKTVAASGDTAIVFFVSVPTGIFWKILELREVGMGRSQLLNAYFRLKRGPALPALPNATTTTWKSNTPITVDVIPDLVSGKDEEFIPPEYLEQNQVGSSQALPEGLPLLFTDRNAAHASTALANVNLLVDTEPIHQLANPSDYIQEYRSAKPDQDVSDTDTLLYFVRPGISVGALPSGILFFEQPKLELATIKWAAYFVPVLAEDGWKSRIAAAAKVAGKNIRAVTNWAAKGFAGQGMKDRFAAFLGATYYPQGTPEFERFYGYVAQRDQSGNFGVDLLNPSAQVAADRSRVAKLKGTGQAQAAERCVRAAIASVPGGVQSGRGFARGVSEANRRIRAALAA